MGTHRTQSTSCGPEGRVDVSNVAFTESTTFPNRKSSGTDTRPGPSCKIAEIWPVPVFESVKGLRAHR